MERDRIEAILRAAYAAREANDADGVLAEFAPGACYRIAGDADACAMASVHRGEALRPAMQAMCSAFQATMFRPTRIIIDGDHAAVAVEARFRVAPTGDAVETRMADIWTFRDGKAVDVTEYLDTALLARLTAAMPPGG